MQSGLLVEARRLYGDTGPAFYGLCTSLVAWVLLSLLRLKRPEPIKEFAPPELGRVHGLDRAPEVKTLRRKLHRLAEGPSETLLLAVAQRRARAREEALARRSRAFAELCHLLDATETLFPGTRLRLRYRVAGEHRSPTDGAA